MPVNIFFDTQEHNVVMICDASTTLEDKLHGISEIEKLLDKHPSANVFVDAREDPVDSLEEEQVLGKAMAQHAAEYNRHKTAILVKRHHSHVLTLTEAYVGGMERIVEFDSESDARHWLRGSIK